MTESSLSTNVELITQLPDITSLYAKAAGNSIRPSSSSGPVALPDTALRLVPTTVALPALAQYNRVCHFPLESTLSPTYPHILGFPLSVKLMTEPSFPFGLLGIIHITNAVTQYRPIRVDEPVEVLARTVNLRPHPKGQCFDAVMEARVEDELVWESASTYLKRGSTDSLVAPEPTPVDEVDSSALPTRQLWRLGGDLGRRYAGVSGDSNPIHMSALSAKAFGFPRAIAHGMWTKARSLAALHSRLPEAFTITVSFRRPMTLPGTVEFRAGTSGDSWDLAVVGKRSETPHMLGRITPL